MLVVLQAIDAAGKDGTIRHVMSGVNPQGVSVHSFKVPSAEELDHDYLWRYARRLPERGETGIFNRSHYEEVLAVRVTRRTSIARGSRRWRGRTIVEAPLPRDQRLGALLDRQRLPDREGVPESVEGGAAPRFLRRIDLADHNWKFSDADVTERERWDDYQPASRKCSRTRARSGRRGRDPRRPQVVWADRPGRCW